MFFSRFLVSLTQRATWVGWEVLLCWGGETRDTGSERPERERHTSCFGEPYFPVCLGTCEAPQISPCGCGGHGGTERHPSVGFEAAGPQGAVLNKWAYLHAHPLQSPFKCAAVLHGKVLYKSNGVTPVPLLLLQKPVHILSCA